MNDEEKLKFFERKLLNISRRCSLVELLLRKIVKNLGFYQELEEYGRKLKSLPVCLRDKVLREFTSLKFDGAFGDSKPNFERKLKDFSFLLSSQTKLIELDGLMSFCPEEILNEQLKRVVQMIAADAPNVLSLIINGRNSMMKIYSYYSYVVDQATLEAICSLSKLKTLEISRFLQVEFSDLMHICEALQSLEYVKVKIAKRSVLDFGSIERFKRSFNRLKEFHFSLEDFKQSRRLERLCIEHLPKLRLMDERDFDEFDIPDVFDLLKLPSETSSLRNLGVYPTMLPIHQFFPDVRHLAIGWPHRSDSRERSIDPLLQFSKLESLFVAPSLPSENIFHQFLDRYGFNLKNLVIGSSNFKLRLGEIMNRCKKLERLILFNESTFSDQPLMPTQTFAELKELTWNRPVYEDSNDGRHLLHLLSSPKLEKVTLLVEQHSGTDPDVLKQISNLIANGHTLRELKSLIIYFNHLTIEEDILPKYDVVNSLITNACVFLPKCTRVVVKPYDVFPFAPFYNSKGEFEGFCYPIRSRTEIDFHFRKYGQPNLAKFLFACRTGKEI